MFSAGKAILIETICGAGLNSAQVKSGSLVANLIGIDPTVDYAFKLLLGNPEHSNVTIHFLNAILSDGPRITHVEFLNPFLGKDYEGDKLSILDILAVDEHGRRLNIEMQTSLPTGLKQRLAFYNSRLYVDQMIEGRAYEELHPAIVICVLNVPLLPTSASMHSDFRLRDQNGMTLTNDLQIHTLELTKLAVTCENLSNVTAVECWAYFLRHAPDLTVDEVRNMFPAPEFTEAAGVLEMINQTPGQLHEYSARLKLRLDGDARIKYARDEGIQKGELLGQIKLLQRFLSESTPTRDQLLDYDIEQLTALFNDLEQRLRSRS